MPAFTDLFPECQTLCITEATPGTLIKSPYEELALAGPGQADALTLYYDALVRSHAQANARVLTFAIGQDMSTSAVTSGTWYAGPAKIVTGVDQLPFLRIAVPCQGLAKAKPNAVRWFAVTETQSAENVTYLGTTWPKFSAENIGYGVEIDRIQIGSQPAMSAVGQNGFPYPAPTVRASIWGSIEKPTRHYPDGWYLADRKSTPILGSLAAWLITDVYRYKYPVTP